MNGLLGRILQVLWLLGVNAIPAWGYFTGRWNAGTALVLYWCENVIGVALVGLRIAIHRHWTHFAGYSSAPAGTSTTINGRLVREGFLGGFLTTGITFAVAHGIFLAAFLGLVPEFRATGVDLARVREALPPMALFLFLGFLVDLVGIRRRPFAWIRQMVDRMLQRTIVVHLTLIFGMFAVGLFHASRGFIAVFVVLKLLADLSGALSQGNPDEQEERKEQEDERVVPVKRSRP